MKLPTLIVTGLFIAPFVMADPDPQQQGKTFGDGACLPKYLAQYDVKGPHGPPDGKLDQEEVQAMKQMREQKRLKDKQGFDTNGDGSVCDQEREQAKLRLRQAIEEHRLVRFTEADTDDDGALSYAEWIVLPGVARKLETDPDRVAEIFDRLNGDDELISEDEFMEGVRQCDQDRDGSGDGKQTGHGGGTGDGSGDGSGGGGGGGTGGGS